jgi:hypothetical protein
MQQLNRLENLSGQKLADLPHFEDFSLICFDIPNIILTCKIDFELFSQRIQQIAPY